MDTIATLRGVREYIESKGFVYDFGIIESLFLSLKTKPYAVISGKNGSGKTSLVRLFAESIGATPENGRFKQITPEADWNSSARLLGHINFDGKYIPGLIVPYIQEAIKNPDYPYFLCIEDMNTARVEQYMGSILSVMETRRFDSEGRIITDSIFDKSYFGIDLSASFSYDSVYLPDNLYIIGTVNSNEYSYPLTTKVLDRMFVIDINADNLSVKHSYEKSSGPKMNTSPLEDITNDFLKSEYIVYADCNSDIEFLSEYTFTIQYINQYMRYLPFSLGFRSRDEIIFYASYARKYDVFDKNTLDDFIIMQRILPRVYGSGKFIKTCLYNLFKICMSNERLNADEYADNSSKMHIALKNYGAKYPRSGERIALMMRRFEEDGFTAFWQ